MNSSVITLFVVVLFISTFESKPAYPEDIHLPQMPPGCEKQNYCLEKSPDYPDTEIKEIMQKLELKSINEPVQPVTDQRLGTATAELTVCETNSALKPIYEIVDEEGYVRYVAQHEHFVQNYTIGTCKQPGTIMKENSIFPPLLVGQNIITCEHIIASPKFLVLSHDRKSLNVVGAKKGIPMGCACRLNGPARMG